MKINYNIDTGKARDTSGLAPGSFITAELKKIYQAIRKILRKAIIRRGTTFSDYRDASGKKGNFSSILSVYGRKGQPCLKCKKEIIQKTKTAGRGTYFCSGCQR